MSEVIHKRGKKRYVYDHHYEDGQVVSKYIRRAPDDIDWDEITSESDIVEEMDRIKDIINQHQILYNRFEAVRDAVEEIPLDDGCCVICGEPWEYATVVSYIPSGDDAECLNSDHNLWAHDDCINEADGDLVSFIRHVVL